MLKFQLHTLTAHAPAFRKSRLKQLPVRVRICLFIITKKKKKQRVEKRVLTN